MHELLNDTSHIIRELEIHTRRILSGTMVGDSRSAVKGSGFEFDQIREYQPGDDVRFIDWHSTARSNKVLVKQCIEERSRNILLVVDVSASTQFGIEASKHLLMAKIASVLGLVAAYGKDRVGCILFSDEVESLIPLGSGHFHVRNIMEQLFKYRSHKKRTRIESALQQLATMRCKNGMAFLISDFIDDSLDSRLMPLISHQYDLVAIRCLDRYEQQLPSLGFLMVEDIESDVMIELDARSAHHRGTNIFLQQRIKEQNDFFKKRGVDLLEVRKEHLIEDIVRFFRKRMSY